MRLRLILFILTGVLQGTWILGQETIKTTGNSRFIQDQRVETLVRKHIAINETRQTISGFRIQIFFDSGNLSKSKASKVYDDFITRFPEIPAYLTFKAPNYKVRIGDFRTRLDAQRFMRTIATEFPDAWVIADEINPPPINPINPINPQNPTIPE